MNKGALLGEILETGGTIAQKSAKVIAKATGDTVKAAGTQVTGSDADTKDIVNSLYGVNDNKKTSAQASTQNQQTSQTGDAAKNPTEDIEKEKKLKELRAQLHREVYYDPLTAPKKPQEEERPAEKVEKEKQQEMVELQEKEKEKPPPLVIQKTQQRVEKFPGSSG